MKSNIELAASFIKDSEFIMIGAGAGIGRDSGLPDFRGDEGFWKNYPPYQGLFNFYECANPSFLEKEPNLFWGFYGSRLQSYRKTQPHKGFQILLNYEKNQGKQIFVLTSNVDGQFQKAGYQLERIYEVHGSIHHLQCDTCLQIIENKFEPKINYEKMSCQVLPKCQKCKEIQRPNILMFYDGTWISERSNSQAQNYRKFLKKIKQSDKPVCFVEIGAGTAITTIRDFLENNYNHNKKSKYIRINPEPEDNFYVDPLRFVHLQLGCLDALKQIQECLQKMV